MGVYPDRFAKRIRESPQLSNLLDGEGFDINDIKDQQIRQMKEFQVQQAMIQADGDAKLLNTMNKKMQTLPTNPVGKKVSGMQTDEPARKTQGVQVEETQYFDMAIDDKVADVNEQIEMELDKNTANQEQKRANIVNILQSHLGEVTQQQTDFVHQLIQPDTGGASSSTAIQPVKKTTTKQSKKDPETAVEPKGKAGRPKKDTDARMEQLEQQSTPEKRERKASNGNGDKPPKAKRKTKKERELEKLALEEERQ